MSIPGVGANGLPAWIRGPAGSQEAGQARAEERAPAERAGAAESRSRVVAPAMADPSIQAPDQAPAGVDAELWSVLTTEERAHFAKFAAMGGVTYGPKATGPSRPAVQGYRLDLKI